MDKTHKSWRDSVARLTGAYAPSTIRIYTADIKQYELWCTQNGIEELFPTSEATLCAFMDASAKTVSPTSVRRRLYSIRKIHRLLNLPDPTLSEEVNLAMRRILRSTPIRPKQAKAATQTYLERFLECQPDTPTGLRNRAMLAVGYELLNRRSELIALQSHDITEQANGTYRVLIRRSKADPFGYGRTAYTSSKTAKILNEWLDVRGPHIPWLFCQIYQNKPIDKGLSPTTVSRVIKQSAEMAGIDKEDVKKFSGHSLRVGAAQDLLIKGFETAAIMRAGGWKSINVLARYLEHAEQNVWEP